MAFARPHLFQEREVLRIDHCKPENVMDEMYKFYQEGRFTDITLLIEGCRFHCHKLVLAANSLYFDRMFSNGMSEASASTVTLNDLASGAVKTLIDFAYTARVTITHHNVLDLFEASDMLQFNAVKDFCTEFLAEQINIDNCLSFMIYADAYSSELLHEKAGIFAAQHFKYISSREEYLNLPASFVEFLLKQNELDMEYEEHVFEALIKWVYYHKEERARVIGTLVKCIRMNWVSRWYLIEVISKETTVSNSAEAMKHVQVAKDQLLAQGHTFELPWQLPPSRKCTGVTNKIVFINTAPSQYRDYEIYMFDPVNKSWSTMREKCPYVSELSTVTALDDALLIIGGWKCEKRKYTVLDTAQEFKIMNRYFPTLWYTRGHATRVPRYLHSSIAIGDKIYIVGGLDDSQSLQAAVLVADKNNLTEFEPCPRMLFPVCRPAVTYHENKIYVIGGFSKHGAPFVYVQVFDIDAQKWYEINGLPVTWRLSVAYATFIQGIIYVVCGSVRNFRAVENPVVGHPTPPRFIDRIKTFHPRTQEWFDRFMLPEPREGNFSIATMDGKIYITGGSKSGRTFNAIECYDPESNTIELVSNIKEGCELSLCTTMNVMHENFGL